MEKKARKNITTLDGSSRIQKKAGRQNARRGRGSKLKPHETPSLRSRPSEKDEDDRISCDDSESSIEITSDIHPNNDEQKTQLDLIFGKTFNDNVGFEAILMKLIKLKDPWTRSIVLQRLCDAPVISHYWQRRALKAEKALEQLRYRSGSLQNRSVRDEPAATDDKVQELARIWADLEQKTSDHRNLSQLHPTLREDFNYSSARKCFPILDALVRDLSHILSYYRESVAVVDLSTITQENLSSLVRRSFHPTIQPAARRTIVSSALGLNIRALVLNLIAAALCCWVFEADVETWFTEKGLCYRKLLELLNTQDSKLADTFNSAVDRECVDDPLVTDFSIPMQAEHLARCMRHCIKPLLETCQESSDILKDWDENSTLLTKIFKLALDVRTQLLLSNYRYRCVFHRPGTPYDDEGMRLEPRIYSLRPENGVKVTIFPQIVCYAVKHSGFDNKRFLTPEDDDNGVKPEYWYPSTVIL